MKLFYLPTPEVLSPPRHRITFYLWDADVGRVDTRTVSQGGPLADGTLSVRVDETVATLPTLVDFAQTMGVLAMPGQSLPRYRVAPPNQIERPDGTLWTITADAERQALFEPLPGPTGIVAFLDGVITDALATAREKQFARILRRLIRRSRQREAGGADD